MTCTILKSLSDWYSYSYNSYNDYTGDKHASQQQSKVQVDSRSHNKCERGLAFDLIEDGKLSRPYINANLIELMMAAVDTVRLLFSIFKTFLLFFLW